CFFFQAEDGIRDKLVTGVQTCALPIFPSLSAHTFATVSVRRASLLSPPSSARTSAAVADFDSPPRATCSTCARPASSSVIRRQQIGRASCRERGEISGGDGAVNTDRSR